MDINEILDMLPINAIVTIILGVFAILSFRVASRERLRFEEEKFESEKAYQLQRKRSLEEETTRISEISIPIANLIKSELIKNTDWLTEALKQAKIGINSNSLFFERLKHFNREKRLIAKSFAPIILNRCKNFIVENGEDSEVFMIIDSGTTTYMFFKELSKHIARNYHAEMEWLKKITIVTNNLQGTQVLTDLCRTDTRNRFSELAINKCISVPGEVVPRYFAIIGDEAENYIKELRTGALSEEIDGEKKDKSKDEKKVKSQRLFIGIISGNWLRVRRSSPRCPIPLVRGKRHASYKQTLIENVDEVFVLSPLGKIFIKQTQGEVNIALKLSGNPTAEISYGGKERYEELKIGVNDQSKKTIDPKKIKLVTTSRASKFALGYHSAELRHVFDHDNQEVSHSPDDEIYTNKEIEDLPHLFFPFEHLPDLKHFEYEVEFPHKQTRNKDFMSKYFSIKE